MKTPVHVELWHGNDWHDMTEAREIRAADPITITSGRGQETERVVSSVTNLSILNAGNHRYSIRNPMSDLWAKIGRNQPIRVWVRSFLDDFTRTVVSGWGTAEDGRGWSTAFVGSGSTSVGGGVGVQTQTTVSGYQLAFLTAVANSQWRDGELRCRFTVSGTGLPNVGGGSIEPANLVLRLVDNNNYLFLRVSITTAEQVMVSIRKLVNNVETTISPVVQVPGLTFTGQTLMASFQAEGEFLSAKVWDPAVGEPFDWQVKAVERTFMLGSVGVRTGVAGGNTNVPVSVSYDKVEVRIPKVCAEVESWPQRWNVSGTDVWAPIKANGIMRRMAGAGTKTLARSAPRRYLDRQTPLAYWALDSGELSTAAALTSGTGRPAFISQVRETGLGRFPMAPWLEGGVSLDFNAFVRCSGVVMPATPATHAVDLMWAGALGQTKIEGRVSDLATGMRWELFMTSGAFNDAELFIYSANVKVGQIGVFGLTTSQDGPPIFDGLAHHLRVTATQSGPDVVWELYIDGVNTKPTYPSILVGATSYSTSSPAATFTTTGQTLTGIDRVVVTQGASGTERGAVGVSHVVVWGTAPAVTAAAGAALGHNGETSWSRIERLAGEEGIPFSASFLSGTILGPQGIKPPLESMFDAAEADGGTLFEMRGFLALAYRHVDVTYNLPVTVPLDYATPGEVADLLPSEDTDHIQNDVTVRRENGGESTLVQQTGPLNVQEPHQDPQGVGRYPVEIILLLWGDFQTLQYAAWRKHLGTWDEQRYKSIEINLTRLMRDGKLGLANRAASLGIGERLTVAHPPIWQGPDTVDQRAQGFTETLGPYVWTLRANTTPAGPWLIGRVGSSRLGTLAATIDVTVSANAASFVVAAPDPLALFSSVSAPYDVMAGGERMTLTAATAPTKVGGEWQQTITVTRSVNGITKPHTAGTPLQVIEQLRFARGLE